MNVKEKLRNLKIFRVIVQIIFFILMPSLFSQAFAGVKEAVALIGKGENIRFINLINTLLNCYYFFFPFFMASFIALIIPFDDNVAPDTVSTSTDCLSMVSSSIFFADSR